MTLNKHFPLNHYILNTYNVPDIIWHCKYKILYSSFKEFIAQWERKLNTYLQYECRITEMYSKPRVNESGKEREGFSEGYT
jgi:hypothetical protein